MTTEYPTRTEILRAMWTWCVEKPGRTSDVLATRATSTFGTAKPVAGQYADAVLTVLDGRPEPDEALLAHLAQTLSRKRDDFADKFMVLPAHVALIRAGVKTMSRRFRRWADPGDRFAVGGVLFEVTEVYRERVGDIPEADLTREGYASLEEYKAMWRQAHPKSAAAGIDWDPDQLCWVHVYRRVEEVHAGPSE